MDPDRWAIMEGRLARLHVQVAQRHGCLLLYPCWGCGRDYACRPDVVEDEDEDRLCHECYLVIVYADMEAEGE